MRLSKLLGATALASLIAASALAGPMTNPAQPYESPSAQVNDVYNTYNATQTPAATVNNTSCTGTTTATCQGLRIAVSYTGLTTAAGVTSALQTVTDASVATTSQIVCVVNGYAGTGNPIAVNVIPGAGSFTYQVQNTHASAALNATVVTNCMVFN